MNSGVLQGVIPSSEQAPWAGRWLGEGCAFAVVAVLLGLPTTLMAQDGADLPPPLYESSETDSASTTVVPEETGGGTGLQTYLSALAERRLLAAETGSVERMRELVRTGETLFLEGRFDEAALDLYEVAESPRFADFVELDEFRGAEYMLGRALSELGALRTAARYLERIIARGPEDLYFGPAFRKLVDVALESGNPQAIIERIEAHELEPLPDDGENELRYLRGRERYDVRDFDGAESHFSEVTRRSRWFASAQYLRGVIAARGGDLQEAEELFCSVATQGNQDRYTFYVDGRFFEVKDLAHLALGRVAHEGLRSEDAFYYYFQVPQDSERVAEALFEASYAMYEGGDYETAVDLLDQLEVRFPESPFVDEAALLRGYVHLGRCEFEEANQLFVRFAERFAPVLREVAQILDNPARQNRLYEELLTQERVEAERRDRGDVVNESAQGLLLSMLRVDPAFYRLHADVRTLDAEAARAGRLATDLGAIAARVEGGDRPRAAAELDDTWDDAGDLRREIEGGRAVLGSLTEQLDTMRGAQATEEQLAPLEEAVQGLGLRLGELEQQLDAAMGEVASEDPDDADHSEDLQALLARDVAHARRLPARIASTRSGLMGAANEAAIHAVRSLAHRLGGGLRRARIGRIDAVMGSKRRIEIQIESLAAGRFPPELRDPLSVQGLLRDDEEYWPFEGELWEDEFDETDPVEELLEE